MKNRGLIEISHNNRKTAIIFVHGLRGDPRKTWLKKGAAKSFPELIAENMSDKDVYTFGYRTNFVLKTISVDGIATTLITEISTRLKNYSSLIFITHSMGGIVVQKLISLLLDKRENQIINKIDGIVYLAVPFYGSNVALLTYLPKILLPYSIVENLFSKHTSILTPLNNELAELSRKWTDYRQKNLLEFEELNIYGLSDGTVAEKFSNVAYIKNSKGVDETHISICKVDMDSLVYLNVKDFLEGITSKKKNDQSNITHYQNWLAQKTSQFYVPRINRPLPINNAAASLNLLEEPKYEGSESLEKAIFKYHEWANLAISNREKKSSYEDLINKEKIVIIGGPGSGKTVLCKKLANNFITIKKNVLYFKFSLLAKSMAQGKTFEEALWSVALDGFSGDKNVLKLQLEQIDVLIGDGLDESGSQIDYVTDGLRDWLIDREDIKVIISTRPVGHNVAKFSDFSYCEILPLENKEIQEYSRTLIELLNLNDAKELYEELMDRIKQNKMVKFSSRSPLLLNFLILLLIGGKDFGNTRAELYERIIMEWIDESKRKKENDLDIDIALRCLEYIGWTNQITLAEGNGLTEETLLINLKDFIKNELQEKELLAKSLSRKCLEFWTRLGILERIEIGYEKGYTFFHMTIGEFMAAKFLHSLKEKEKLDFLNKNIHKAIWRETFLLTAGVGSNLIFIKEILKRNSEKEDLYNEISLAAAMLSEHEYSLDVAKEVANEAVSMLESDIPQLCIETCEYLIEIARQNEEWMFEIVNPLFSHEYEWTKIVAYRLALETKKIPLSLELVYELMELQPSLDTTSFIKRNSIWIIWNDIMTDAVIEIINADILDKKQLKELLGDLKDVGTNLNLERKIAEILKTYDEEVLDWYMEDRLTHLLPLQEMGMQIQSSMATLLDLIIEASTIEVTSEAYKGDDGKKELRKFVSCLNLDGSIGEFYVLNQGKREEVLALFKSIIFLYDLNEGLIYNASLEVKDSNKDFSDFLIKRQEELSVVDKRIKNIDCLKLLQAVSHPCEFVQRNAAIVLCKVFQYIEAPSDLEQMFYNAEGKNVLFYGVIIINALNNNDIMDILFKKLRKEEKGLNYILRFIGEVDYRSRIEELSPILINLLDSEDHEIFESLAGLLKGSRLVEKEEVQQKILYTIDKWDEKGVPCENDGIIVKGLSCPKCNIVPMNPIEPLLDLLKEAECLNFDKRIHYATHPNSYVNSKGQNLVVLFLNQNDNFVSTLINYIRKEKCGADLINLLFKLETEIIYKYLNEIVTLYHNPNEKLREKLISNFGQQTFKGIKVIEDLIENALNDKSRYVKDVALKSYRQLEMGESTTSTSSNL